MILIYQLILIKKKSIKKLQNIIIAIFLLLTSSTYAQLPEVATTKEKALDDLARDISNESWYKMGDKAYACYFRLTPVGIKHAFERYNEMKEKYDINKSCEDKDLLSSIVVKTNGDLDYEWLANTIITETSEVKRSCFGGTKEISAISFGSIGGRYGYVVLILLKK